MLSAIHDTLQRLLYERGQISSREVDIVFEAPTRERVEKLLQPTMFVFLYDIRENTDLRQGSFQTTQHNGRAERRMMPRRFDLSYMLTAQTTHVEDEHQLLWRSLTTLLQYPHLPDELLAKELREAEPAITTRISHMDESQFSIWTALGMPPHPALHYVVTVPIDMTLLIEAPLVLTRTTRYARYGTRGNDSKEIMHHIGGVVYNKQGEPLAGIAVAVEGRSGSVTNHEGRFKLHGIPSGTVTLQVTQADGTQHLVTVDVPPEQQSDASVHGHSTYDIVLDTAQT